MKELAQGYPANKQQSWALNPYLSDSEDQARFIIIFFFFLFSLFYCVRNLFPSHIQNIKSIFTVNYASLLSFFHTKINDHFLKKTEINPEVHTFNRGTTPRLLKLLFLEFWDIQHFSTILLLFTVFSCFMYEFLVCSA